MRNYDKDAALHPTIEACLEAQEAFKTIGEKTLIRCQMEVSCEFEASFRKKTSSTNICSVVDDAHNF